MKKQLVTGAALIVALGAVLGWRAEPMFMSWKGAQVEKMTVAGRADMLNPAIELRLPGEGDGPFPVVIQLHGCAGVSKVHHRQWAEVANEAGYAAMIVDSITPRGMTRDDAVEYVCSGKALLGQERTGDILAAYELVRNDPRLDASRIILAGWSHGAWTLMDYLTMGDNLRPPGLAGENIQYPPLLGAIAFYPYCGRGALVRFHKVKQAAPMLAFIAGADEIVDAGQCISWFEKKKRKGADIDLVIYEKALHAYDHPDAEDRRNFSDDMLDDTKARYRAFLTEHSHG